MKKEYMVPESELITLLSADVITASDDYADDIFTGGYGEEGMDDTAKDNFAPIA